MGMRAVGENGDEGGRVGGLDGEEGGRREWG